MRLAPIAIMVACDPHAPAFERHGEPVSVGVALPRGGAHRDDHWALLDPAGAHVPLQVTTLDWWGDGSVRWVLVEFQADLLAGATSRYSLVHQTPSAAEALTLSVEHAGEAMRVDTGAAAFDLRRNGPAFLSQASVDGVALLGASAIDAEDLQGGRYQFRPRQLTLERVGAVTAVVRIDGGLCGANEVAWLDARLHLQFFAGLGTVKASLAITNPRAARHPGGAWDLGDPGSVLIRDLSVRLTPTASSAGETWASLDCGEPMTPAGPRFSVTQVSSGGSNWRHPNHMNREGQVPELFRGFRAWRREAEVTGLRATPIASIGSGNARISIAMPRFWEVFPKALVLGPQECTIGILPKQYSDTHELQGGERTTFTFLACVGRETVSAEPLAWARSPLSVAAEPQSYRLAGAWAPLAAGTAETRANYELLVNQAIEGDHAFALRRDAIDEYGWRNFGEIYADHEAVNANPPDGGQAIDAMVSHYNNQYDAVAGFATRFLQTGDSRWWAAMDQLAAHVTDIDLYHTTRDRAAYNGGYFWHTQHHAPAGTATHRAYSRRSGTSGGGPSAEHNYTTGLLLHHFLTGSAASRAAVIQLADWVLDMDDGRKSRFRWIDRSDTGLASGTRSPDFHGPGRGAGNSINALLDAHRLTGFRHYLDKADSLIARCVHPDDDPESFDLKDAENRWSYTVFLQALGKYLDHRADRGLIDEPFAYARAVLLNYASWMAANERPYLDAPDRLEHPTETWAAQDVRKAAVFEFAARHAVGDDARGQFLAKADFFFDYAVTALRASPTGRLSRPLVLLLAYGFQRPLMPLPTEASVALPAPSVNRAPFVPLRRRLLRRLVLAGAGLSAAALVLLVLFIS